MASIPKEMLGAVKSKKDVRNYRIVCGSAAEDCLPTEFSLVPPAVRNQGTAPKCTLFSVSSCIEYHYRKQHPEYADSDTRFSIVYLDGTRDPKDNYGEGSAIAECVNSARNNGDVFYSTMPGVKNRDESKKLCDARREELDAKANEHRITAFAECKTVDEIKHALYNGWPVVFGLDYYEDMKFKDGVLDSPTRKGDGKRHHCMFIYGWNEKGWLIQNSWGEFWGSRGRAIIPYDMPIFDAFAIIDDNIESGDFPPDIRRPFHSLIGKIIAKLLNFILNIIFRK